MNVFTRTYHRIASRIAHRNTFVGGRFSGHQIKLPPEPFYPKLISVLRGGYDFADFVRDMIAGLVVGIVSIPAAMACAIASGVDPIQGLNTAIIAGLVIGLLGGSRFQVSAPTGAFVVIVYDIVYRHGYDGLVITTLIAGVILCLAGFFRLGGVVKYIPYSVVTGFTSGIGVIIFSQQMGEFIGLANTHVPPDFISKWSVYLSEMDTFNPLTLGLGVSSLFIMILINRLYPKIPAAVCGVIIGTLVVWYFDMPVHTVESRYGAVEGIIPPFQMPDISFERVRILLPDAITIAILAGLESLLTCVVADSMTGDRHYSNIELVAQGVGNVTCSMFNGIPATGAMVRTATNISNGARSPIAAIFQGFLILIFVLWFSPVISAIPLTCLAAVMIMTSYGMFETHAIKNILKGPSSDIMVMGITFFLTVIFDLTIAVYTGVLLASLLFMRRMSYASHIKEIEHETIIRDDHNDLIDLRTLPDGVHLFNISGPFFFGMVDRFQYAIGQTNKNVNVFVLQMRDVPTIDATGLHVLESFLAQRNLKDYDVVLAEVPAATRRLLRNTGLTKLVGEDNICHHLSVALQRATELSLKKSK